MADNKRESLAALLREHAARGAGVVGARRPGMTTEPTAPDEDRSPAATVISWLQAPCFALQFLTVLPPLIRRPARPDDLGRSETFFPVVGLLIGGLLAAVDWLLTPMVPPLVRDVTLVALLAMVTGALHLDGVVDTFDGLFTGKTPERRLEIMRDPRAGSYGVVAVVLLLAFKLAALTSLPPAVRAPALILAPCLARWGIVLVTGAFAYARPEGMGRDFKASVRWTHVIVAGTIALVAAAVIVGPLGILAWTVSSLAVLIAGQWVAGRLGGLSGDTYGATCEIVEAGVLVLLGLCLGGMLG